jgi:hypothetical protein
MARAACALASDRVIAVVIGRATARSDEREPDRKHTTNSVSESFHEFLLGVQ